MSRRDWLGCVRVVLWLPLFLLACAMWVLWTVGVLAHIILHGIQALYDGDWCPRGSWYCLFASWREDA